MRKIGRMLVLTTMVLAFAGTMMLFVDAEPTPTPTEVPLPTPTPTPTPTPEEIEADKQQRRVAYIKDVYVSGPQEYLFGTIWMAKARLEKAGGTAAQVEQAIGKMMIDMAGVWLSGEGGEANRIERLLAKDGASPATQNPLAMR